MKKTQNNPNNKSDKKSEAAKRAHAAAIFARLAEHNPDPQGELKAVNPFTLLIAIMLSAQATDVGVNKATQKLFQIADTPEKILELGEESLKEYIRTINLYRTKARNILGMARMIRDHFGGTLPQSREALETLPGVGRKTANVLLSQAFGLPTIAVDTHVFRIAHRLALANGKTPLAVEEELMQITPKDYQSRAHLLLILHGRYTCKARKPECWRCVVADLCPYEPKTPAPSETIPREAGARL